MRMVGALDTHVAEHTLPLGPLEVVLDCLPLIMILKYPIDCFTLEWIGETQPIFSYMNLGYALNSASDEVYKHTIIGTILFMNAYWISQVILFGCGFQWGRVGGNIRKLTFLIIKNVFFLPLVNTVLT